MPGVPSTRSRRDISSASAGQGSRRQTAANLPAAARPPESDQGGAETIEGRNPVLEALRAGRPINKILLAQGVGRPGVIVEILGLAKEAGVLVERTDGRGIERLSRTGKSQGVLAMASVKAYVTVERLLEIGRERQEPSLLVILDHIEDPHNLGAIIRAADGAGAHGVVIPDRRAAALTAGVARASAGAVEHTAGVARASAGAVEHMPVARVTNLLGAMSRLAKNQVWTVGIDPSGEIDYTLVDYRQPTVIVIGAEGKGLSRPVKERCDLLASIPMRGKVASLNAAVAAALVMYEAAKQRRPA